MKIYRDLEECEGENLALTLGNFDALHLGHQALIQALKKKGVPCLLTFSNHPSTVLSKAPKKTLLSLPHKLHLLKKYGIEKLVLVPFTAAFSQWSAFDFLSQVRKKFSYLLLGYDARIGHKREGDEKKVREIASTLNLEVDFLAPTVWNGHPVSSSQIRTSLQEGNLKHVHELLGRPYTLFGEVQRGQGKGRVTTFRTMNLDVSNLCLPPQGVWAVKCIHKGKSYKAVANLGLAPTLRTTSTPLLEVHIPHFTQEIYGEFIEVEFLTFLRGEKKFTSIEDLKKQIAQDVENALL